MCLCDHVGVSATMQLLSVTANSHLQQVCVGHSSVADIICYNSSGRRMSALSTAGVGVFAISYNLLSGWELHHCSLRRCSGL